MSEELSVSIDVKCDKVNTKAFATELVKSMNQALAYITSSINSMNAFFLVEGLLWNEPNFKGT